MRFWLTTPFEKLYAEPSRNGLNRPKRVRGSGYKMVNMGELFSYDRIKDIEMDLVPMNEAEKEKYSLKKGDLLFARQSLVAEGAGKCSIILETSKLTTFESHLIRIRLNPNKANSLFYYYYFVSPQGKNNVQSLVMQVAAAGIRASELSLLSIPCPPLPTQQKIASILSAYDDLIENNTRRIKILEEMAQMLYREWFVNFRFPDHEQVKMVESAIGLIPEGWEFKQVSDFGKVITGKTPSTKVPEYYGDFMPFIKTPSMHGNIFCTEVEEFLSELGVNSQKIKTIPPNSLIVNCIGALAGSVSITVTHAQTNQQINAVVLKDVRTREFLYFALVNSKELLRQQGANGATMINVNKSKFESLPAIYPKITLINQFHDLVSSHLELVKNLTLKNINLRKTRDLLLPKLISGEIDIEKLDIDTLDLAA